MSIEIKELVTNPETAPFSRLKYLARSSEEEVTRFFNSLFNLATLAREANDWTSTDGPCILNRTLNNRGSYAHI